MIAPPAGRREGAPPSRPGAVPAAGCLLIAAAVLVGGGLSIWWLFWVGRYFGGEPVPGALVAAALFTVILASASGAVLLAHRLWTSSRGAWRVAVVGLTVLVGLHGAACLAWDPARWEFTLALLGPVVLYVVQLASLWKNRHDYRGRRGAS